MIAFAKSKTKDPVVEEFEKDLDHAVSVAKSVMKTPEFKEFEKIKAVSTPDDVLRVLLQISMSEHDPVVFAFKTAKVLEKYRVIKALETEVKDRAHV